MLDIINKQSRWDDMWKRMDALMRYPFEDKTLETNGLRTLIRRPHNLVNMKDESGNVIAQRLEVVTTPFAKNEVKVTLSSDRNTLTVSCGSENKEDSAGDDYIYKGISSQTYTFSVMLSDKVDRNGIKAKNVDGVLTVTLPFKEDKELEEECRSIEVE